MLGFAIAFATMAFGALTGSDALTGVGIAAFIILAAFELIRPQPKARPAPEGGGTRYRHKLLDAPQDAWENNDEALWQHMMSMPGGGLMGKPGNIGLPGLLGDMPADRQLTGMLDRSDPFNSAYGKLGSGMVGNRVRDFLPFPGYGRQSILEQIFIGMPLSITAMIKGKK
jgi:hypothetical protein